MLLPSCWMFEHGHRDGGGNIMNNGHPRIIVRRSLAIGDALCATCVSDRLSELGYECEFQAHQNLHCVLKHSPGISALTVPQGFAHVDLDRSYETNASRRTLHFSEMFMDRAREILSGYGITLGPALNCRPKLILPRQIKEVAACKFVDRPHPWIFFVPRSNSYAVRQVPDPIWEQTAKRLPGTCFWLGTMPAPAGIVDLSARHMDNVVAWLSAADFVVSVDTGPMHIAAALSKRLLCLGQSSSPELHLSDQRDFETIWPEGNLTCLNCQENICRINHYLPPCQSFDPAKIADKVIRKLNGVAENAVSAAIAIYRPDAAMLNRCLECLLPQVQEIVVALDQAGIKPPGALEHGKIRYITHRQFNIGYGRKMNFATRHTHGRYVLQINDDVFLNPGAVDRLKECMSDGVGIVSALLRYPDGTIQHAGKIRSPGQRGWSHINHRQHLPDFKDVTEQENTCGACWLVDREAHFRSGGFDERFFIYAEDDDYCLRMRKTGYRILFTPHASGTHLEHQSTSKTGPIVDHLNNSNRVFGQLWGPYLEYNSNRIPGNFDYCKV